MTTHNGDVVRYNVHLSDLVKAWIRATHRQQAEAGRGKVFVAAIRKIVERLQIEPFVFGEPSYHLPALQLQVRSAVVWRLGVNYAVHQSQPLVFIRSLTLLS